MMTPKETRAKVDVFVELLVQLLEKNQLPATKYRRGSAMIHTVFEGLAIQITVTAARRGTIERIP